MIFINMLISLFHKIYCILYLSLIKHNNKNLSIGNNVKIDYNTKIYSYGNQIDIGENVYLRSKKKGYHGGMPFSTTILVDKRGAICRIGDNCRLNGVYIHAKKNITIKNNTVIAAGVNIIDSNGHRLYSTDRTQGHDEPVDIYIGENVWIGLNVVILKGTSIGSNSVVSAGSVVKGVYPKNSLIQGNPAKIIKNLEL